MAGAPRVDPRAQRQGRNPDSGRIRIDRRSPASAAEPRDGGSSAVAAEGREGAPIIAIDQPLTIVIAVPDLDRGKLTALDRDLFGAARALADAGGSAVLAAVPPDCRDDLGAAGADRVVRFGPLARGAYAPERLAPALVELARAHQAGHLVFADTPTGGGDIGRRVAACLNVRPAVHV
ncbi:MAG TPA: hypothetical protein VET66_08905, partial [Steroidobacteraceae bacterium]|nr:hypothetical protein [Steroidobacteraceae bacterium]